MGAPARLSYACVRERYSIRVDSRSLTVDFGRYVPDSSGRRALIFLLLFVYHGAHSLSKTYAMALLAQVSWLALIVYTVADHVAFQLLKLVCNDFIYWMPGFGAIFSSISRFVSKVVTDFTGTLCIPPYIEIEI
jgi:hypothetical protein